MTIKMLDCGETATTWYKNENQKFLDLLEETIYIQWELEPYYRDWKSHLRLSDGRISATIAVSSSG